MAQSVMSAYDGWEGCGLEGHFQTYGEHNGNCSVLLSPSRAGILYPHRWRNANVGEGWVDLIYYIKLVDSNPASHLSILPVGFLVTI
jgi:hypothetical protein